MATLTAVRGSKDNFAVYQQSLAKPHRSGTTRAGTDNQRKRNGPRSKPQVDIFSLSRMFTVHLSKNFTLCVKDCSTFRAER